MMIAGGKTEEHPRRDCPSWFDLKRIGAEKVLEGIATEHNLLDGKSVFHKTRNPRVVEARDHFLAVLRWSTSLSLPELGFIFHLDHTSVLMAIRRHENVLNGKHRYSNVKGRNGVGKY